MIFITCGTLLIPFDRLIHACTTLFTDPNEKIVIQSGVTKVPYHPHFIVKNFIPNDQMVKYIQQARIIITAAGEGTVFQIIEYGKVKPILFPRLRKYHEHIDDHQRKTAEYFRQKELAYIAENEAQLQTYLKHTELLKKKHPLKLKVNQNIIDELIAFTENVKSL